MSSPVLHCRMETLNNALMNDGKNCDCRLEWANASFIDIFQIVGRARCVEDIN